MNFITWMKNAIGTSATRCNLNVLNLIFLTLIERKMILDVFVTFY